MVTETVAIKGMHCTACEKTITRILQKEGVTFARISHVDGTATITHDLSKKRIAMVLRQKGYSLVDEKKLVIEKNPVREAAFERKLVMNGLLNLVVLIAVQLAMLIFLYPLIQGYEPRHFAIFLYLPLAISVNVLALWHQRAYQREVSCMTGMMVGMTIGMTAGFMISALIGLTNGMFTGAVVGTIIGCAAGFYAGRCCGLMGMMEGMMAGLMAGTMGAMLSVMMVVDHVLWFIPFLFVICGIILAGLMRIVYDEHKDGAVQIQSWSPFAVMGLSIFAMLVLSLIMILAPKGLY